ncbi:MAG: hypothetical protein A2096_08650 [Spirochaetes bacterium GWF1_41_5]|nr:MAG: hypothetical protein A2096_08650 [Spirochaetes bacterium GWF1_41_5]HBE01545.1 hypothetical protein [Spirochaetia bacterium]
MADNRSIFRKLLDLAGTIPIYGSFGILLIITCLTMPLFFLFSIFFPVGRVFRFVIHHVMRYLFFLLRITVPKTSLIIENHEMIKKLRSCIIVCNHLSMLDPIFIMSLNRETITIVKNSLFKIPLFGWMMYFSGFFPNNMADASEPTELVMAKIGKFLKQGGNLLIFPEGTRSVTGKPGNFRKGAFNLAIRLKVPIVCLQVQNSHLVQPKGYYCFRTNRGIAITLRVLTEITGHLQNDYSFSQAKKLRDSVYKLYTAGV